jgi:hypothetical protein
MIARIALSRELETRKICDGDRCGRGGDEKEEGDEIVAEEKPRKMELIRDKKRVGSHLT